MYIEFVFYTYTEESTVKLLHYKVAKSLRTEDSRKYAAKNVFKRQIQNQTKIT